MRMALALVVLACLGMPAAAMAKRAPNPCKGGSTIARSSEARVFKKTNRSLEDGYDVFACTTKGRKRRKIGSYENPSGDPPSGPVEVHLTGHFAAWDDYSSSKYDGSASGTVGVLDVKTGKVRHSAVATGFVSQVNELVVGETGAVAWIRTRSQPPGGTSTRELRKLDSAGEAVLDTAPDLSGLSLSGSTLSWTSGGQPKSAQLSG